MGKLTMPKNNIEMDIFQLVLKIFYDDGGWIDNETLIERLKSGYRSLGRDQETGPEGYTKKAQIPAYFGFIIWEDGGRSARKMISSTGRAFYEALISQNQEEIISLLINALGTNIFGRNNSACKSDSDIEAPCIFVLSSIILGGLTYQEFAYILGELLIDKEYYPRALAQVRQARKSRTSLPLGEDNAKFKDAKPIIFLERCGLLERIDNLVCVKESVLDRYSEELTCLKLFNTTLYQDGKESEWDDEPEENISRTNNNIIISNEMKNFIDALKTKPFLLLAGISGTGKSQKVKELAYLTCPKNGKLDADANTPGNYCLIEVKPNWHDSTELLGYYSNLSEMYMVTPFLHFVYKAIQNPTVPFFVCLDEMNLAPVEQYFAEYLSVLETRAVNNGKIESAELLKKDLFSGIDLEKKYSDEDLSVVKYIKENGLRLPENLFVVGTVNMDDTTHQFSRKVIDRAFTIEMNGDELSAMFDEENEKTLQYNNEPLSLDALKPKYVRASDALKDEDIKKYAEGIKKRVPAILGDFNEILKNTPFRVSYRVQNELVLYLSTLILKADGDVDLNKLINEAALIILLEKILPRVQGDEKMLNTEQGNVFVRLKKLIGEKLPVDAEKSVMNEVIAKLDEMDNRLNNTYFANFF